MSIPQTNMLSPTGPLLGVVGGQAALKVIIPTFTIKRVGQTTPLASLTNYIFLTLQTNVDLSSSDLSRVSMVGFGGLGANGSLYLPLVTGSGNGQNAAPLLCAMSSTADMGNSVLKRWTLT